MRPEFASPPKSAASAGAKHLKAASAAKSNSKNRLVALLQSPAASVFAGFLAEQTLELPELCAAARVALPADRNG